MTVAFKALEKLSDLKRSILTIVGLNAILTVEDTLIILTIRENKSFSLGTPAATLAIIAIVGMLGICLGSILVSKNKHSISVVSLLLFSALFLSLLLLALWLQIIYLVLLMTFGLTVLIGYFNPKIEALIANTVPENQLATIQGGLTSLFTLGMIFSRLIISLLLIYFSAKNLSALLFLLSLVLLGYTIINTRVVAIKIS
ncbi:hypothetical protein ACVR09_06010 [Streptococcus catagoni]